MNLLVVGFVIGTALLIEGGLIALPLFAALWYHEPVMPWLITMAVCLVPGFLLRRKKVETEGLLSKEGVVSTGLCWIALSLTGMLPFLLCGAVTSPIDAFFETVSGYTTTGSTILRSVEVLPRSLLLWRSFLHWIGGMGILVFMMALIPLSGGTQMNLMKAESPGPSISKLVPKAQDTARILYAIYGVMTIVTIVILFLLKMPLFDAVCIGFGAAGTGGFSVLDSGCASYTYAQQVVITIAMTMFGVNFNFYYLFYLKRIKDALRMEEVRAYLAILLGAILLVTIDIAWVGKASNVLLTFHQAAFHCSSIMTTTGYATLDMNAWPSFSRTIIMLLMIVGACAGSTGGGLKVSRVILLFKSLGRECTKILHPAAIKKVHMDGRTVDETVIRSTQTYFFIYVLGIVLSILLVSIDNRGWDTTISAVFATFNNIGPGFGAVGSMDNYADFSPFAKVVLSMDMLIGRLEIFPIVLLFTKQTWRKF